MAKVTIELRNLLNNPSFNLFDFTYTIEDLAWKTQLEDQVKKYFYFHEIGMETPDRFKHRFMTLMQIKMPYYNQLYKSQLLVIDPLLTHYLTETLDDNKSINSTSQANSDTVFTEFPEHTSIVDDIASNKSQSLSGNTQGTTAQHDYEKVIQGYQGKNVNELLASYRKNMLNINELIINDLKQCFILNYTA
jgi:hypothetical protein